MFEGLVDFDDTDIGQNDQAMAYSPGEVSWKGRGLIGFQACSSGR